MLLCTYDIREFYPSITEKAVDAAVKLAKEYILISKDDINIMKHCRKSLLYHNDELRIKKVVNGDLSNPMCSFNKVELSGIMVRVFANGPGHLGSIPGRAIPKTQKMALHATLLNSQHYKVRINGKVEQSREWGSELPYTLV